MIDGQGKGNGEPVSRLWGNRSGDCLPDQGAGRLLSRAYAAWPGGMGGTSGGDNPYNPC